MCECVGGGGGGGVFCFVSLLLLLLFVCVCARLRLAHQKFPLGTSKVTYRLTVSLANLLCIITEPHKALNFNLGLRK